MALGIGETLRAARRRQNRSLADAAAQTRVRETYLAALEEEEFAALGGDVYVKGFLRSYAKYLGLDPEPLLDAYRSNHERSDDLSPLASSPVEAMGGDRSPQFGIAAAIIGVLVVILAIIGIRGGSDDTQPMAAPAPVVTTPTALPTSVPDTAPGVGGEIVSTPTPTPTPETPEAAFESVDAVLTVDGGPTYLRTEQGTPSFNGELADGETAEFSGDPVLELRIGNAGVVDLVVDGQDQGALGAPGQVVVVTCAPGETACSVEEITQ